MVVATGWMVMAEEEEALETVEEMEAEEEAIGDIVKRVAG